MTFRVDTNLLIWAATDPEKLYMQLQSPILQRNTTSCFLVLQVFAVKPYIEIKVSSLHAIGVSKLPQIPRDPFDRLFISTARWENITLLTNDQRLIDYGLSVEFV